jgi:diaminopimelate epimerase
MQFFKAHGAGNDFVVIPDRAGALDLTPAAVVALCDRRFGIGADGVLRLAPAEDAHVFMDYRNGGDGAPVEMCGNGVRVVAAHLVEHGWTEDRELRIATRAGVRVARVATDDAGLVREVDVDMGPPVFGVDAVGLDRSATEVVGGPGDAGVALTVEGGRVGIVPVSMGNPHAVVVVDDPALAPVATLGPAIETAPAFADGTNVEFVAARGRDAVELRVWERGVGETLACGTGVCGAVAALTRDGHLDAGVDVTVTVLGGTLRVRWDGGPQDAVHLIGPAVEVATVEPSPALLTAAGLTVPAAP